MITGFTALERLQDDPLLEQRDRGDADLDAEVSTRDHDRVGLREDLPEHLDRLGLLDLRDHLGMRAGILDQPAQVDDVLRRADERERHVVDAEREGQLQVAQVLGSQRRDRERHAREVHPLVRADGAADHDRAAGATAVHLLDPKADEPVVDQHLVPGREHLADDRRRDGQIAVARALLRRDDHLVPGGQGSRRREVADTQLRPLEIGDQGERTGRVVGGATDQVGRDSVLLVCAVREVQPGSVDAGGHESGELLWRAAGRPDRRKDLRPPRGAGHEPKRSDAAG